jgi:uncharacterized Zn finger protein
LTEHARGGEPQLAVAFLGTFESLRMGPTFARGRRDERAGHVRQLTVSGSLVVALVRGPDDAKAFRARIAVRSFGAAEWARVEQDLAAEARFAAELLAGRMPAGIGAVFEAAGLSLLPLSLDEVAMDCACERWPMPCVHLAATCYALARSFEADPFGVFTWRGRGRDELLLHLRDLRSASAFEFSAAGSMAGSIVGAAGSIVEAAGSAVGAGGSAVGAASSREDGPDDRGDPAETGDFGDIAAFWGGAEVSGAPVGGRPGAASRPDALLDQLDPPPLSHEGRPIVDLLRPAYQVLPEE